MAPRSVTSPTLRYELYAFVGRDLAGGEVGSGRRHERGEVWRIVLGPVRDAHVTTFVLVPTIAWTLIHSWPICSWGYFML